MAPAMPAAAMRALSSVSLMARNGRREIAFLRLRRKRRLFTTHAAHGMTEHADDEPIKKVRADGAIAHALTSPALVQHEQYVDLRAE